ncbi:MAG: GNAT family N-acetyltransferase, partial [Bryobacteraceae bacterium]
LWNDALNAEVRVRPARPEEAEAIGWIQDVSPGASRWPAKSFFEHDVRVAEVETAIAGFIVSRGTVEGEREILSVAVSPRWRRRGIARMLVGDELAKSPADLFLEVRESNEAARRLYGELGFREIGRRPGYYDNPSEAAIVMRWKK